MRLREADFTAIMPRSLMLIRSRAIVSLPREEWGHLGGCNDVFWFTPWAVRPYCGAANFHLSFSYSVIEPFRALGAKRMTQEPVTSGWRAATDVTEAFDPHRAIIFM